MKSIRKWFCKPKRSDHQLLAQFYFANEELNEVSQELDSFDGRQDPERCTSLVNHLRRCQDKVLAIIEQIMVEAIPRARATRDYRAKFPEDVLLDSLPGQLWFGAECLGAGSTIMNREIESAALRPLARGLTKTLDTMRVILKEQCYDNVNEYSDKVKDILKKFDETFAEFELSYVSTMVPVKSAREYDTQQDVIVLFCETLNRALSQKLLTQDQVDDYDPGLMFTIPRLAIVCGLVVFPEGPLNMDKQTNDISELFRPFQALLHKIKELLQTLSEEELHLLEKALCNSNGSWEDIEQQLRLMGKGQTVRCHIAVQTDPLDTLTETTNKADGDFLMFGMSPVEEVKGHVENEINILGTSPDEVVNGEGQSSVPTAQGGETMEDGSESNSSGIEEDSHREEDGISSSPSEKSPGDLSNGDIFDDVDSHTLGMSPIEQKVQYSVSPKHKPITLRKPLLDRVNSLGHDSMSHLYGMSPVEPHRPGFGRDSPMFGMSPLGSPILDSYTVSHARSDVLGMSPVDSVPMVACKVTTDVDVENIQDKCLHGFETADTRAKIEEPVETQFLKCNYSRPGGADIDGTVSNSDANHNKSTPVKSPETNLTWNLDGVKYVETILKEIKSAENHTGSTNQVGDSRSVQSGDKSATIALCQELVHDIVSYAVQYSTFTRQHHGGRCLTGTKVSSDSEGTSPICQSCAKAFNAKEKPDELYCRQCKPKEKKDSPLLVYQDSTTTNLESKAGNVEFVKKVEGDSKIRPTTIGNVSVLSLENAKSICDDEIGKDGSVARQQESRCACAIAPSSDNNTKCSFSSMASPQASIGAGDAQTTSATKAPPSDDATTRCNKCLSPLSDNTLQDTEIIYSTGALQRSEAAGGTPEGAVWNSETTETPWESPLFGKGKPSTELSHAMPQSERLPLHVDVSEQFTGTSSDNSNTMQSELYNSRNHSSYQVSSPSSGRVYPASAINRVTGSRGLVPESALGQDAGERDRRESNVSIAICSSCGDELVDDDDLYQWESEDSDTDSTSSMSDNDEHEIAIAIQAAELSARQEARSHFTSSWDLVHRLFVCIAGVADQLQTNYASDLRNILKNVFEITANPHKPIEESEMSPTPDERSSEVQSLGTGEQSSSFDDDIQLGATTASIQEETSELTPEEQNKTSNEEQQEIEEKDVQQENTVTPSVEQAPLNAEGVVGSPGQEGTAVADNQQGIQEERVDEVQQSEVNDKLEDTPVVASLKESPDNGQESKEASDRRQVDDTNDKDVLAQPVEQDNASSDLKQDETLTDTKDVTFEAEEESDKSIHENLHEGEISQTGQINDAAHEVSADDDVEGKDDQQNQSEAAAVADIQQTAADNQQTTADNPTFSSKYPEIGSASTTPQASFDRQESVTADNQQIELQQETDDIQQDDVFDELQQAVAVGETAQGMADGSDRKCLQMAFDHQMEPAVTESSPAVKPKKKRHKSGDLLSRRVGNEEPPLWVPDEECSQCTSCKAVFTMIRRKHHCRNCGKIFCSRCSANCVPLPRFGQEKPVRVCNRCYMFHVTPFQH